MRTATRHGFLFNQMLFTARRLLYSATLATGALAIGAGVMGLKFNATMEQNEVAMTFFTGSVTAARKELDFLFKLAAFTPFEFVDLTDAARKFLAFGFTVQQTNQYLTTIGDTIAGLGLSAEGINRAVIAIGQMQAKGRVMGQEILQLTELGIPALQILTKELGLSERQVLRIGETGLRASVGIPALIRGMNRLFGGSAALQAKTFTGQLSTIRDLTSQILGTITKGLFNYLRGRVFPNLVKDLTTLNGVMRDRGWMAFITTLDEMIGAQGRLVMAVGWLARVFRNLWTVLSKSVWPSVVFGFKVALPGLILVLYLAGAALGLLAENAELVKLVLTVMITRFIILRTWALVTATLALTKALIFSILWWGRVILVMVRARWAAIVLAFTMTRLRITFILLAISSFGLRAGLMSTVGAMLAASKAGRALIITFKLLRVAMVGAVMGLRILSLALLTTPVGWVILGISALIIIFVILWKKWEGFRNFIKGNWKLMLLGMISPLIGAIFLVKTFINNIGKIKGAVASAFSGLFDPMKDAFKGALNWIIGKWSNIQFSLGGWSIRLPFMRDIHIPKITLGVPDIPLLAMGGRIETPGYAVVGERGPELLSLPSGALVQPLDALTAAWRGGGRVLELHTHVNLDGREIGTSVTQYELDELARR